MLTVTVTLTTAGTDTGPFNIFSNASIPAFSSALNGTPVPKTTILAGVTLTNVPDGTTILRVKSLGACENYIDIPVTPPSQCQLFLLQGGPTVGNVATYRDCATDTNIELSLDNGDSELVCAYITSPYYPAFTEGTGTVAPKGDCSAQKLPCKQYMLYAIPGGGGATFRYIPCDETASIEEIVADGSVSNVCINPYFDPQLVSGSGSITDSLVNCTTTTTTSSTSTTTSTTTSP